jgi:peptidoglycan hydrolase CwlO-like protein
VREEQKTEEQKYPLKSKTMNLLFIMLAQSTTGPVIEIILLLIGAVLIGFLTAWFYQKSVYTPVIKKLEDEKDELNRKIISLNNEITGLNKKIGDLQSTIASKDKEIDTFKKELSDLKKARKEA